MNGEEEKSYWVNAALGHIKKKKKNFRWACSRVFKTWLKQNLAKQS